jgi:hypothetical protein
MSPLDSRVLSNGVNCEEDDTACGAACQQFCVLWDQEGSVAYFFKIIYLSMLRPTHHFSTYGLHFDLCRCEITKDKGKGHPRTGHRGAEGE